MDSLEELARKKFADPPLSAAEERAVQAASDGTIADCRDLGESSDPEKADGTPETPDEKWPEARNVRAKLIRWLCVDREARELVDQRGVWIVGARIIGEIDLSLINVLFSLFLGSCRLEQSLNLLGAKIPLLVLQGSWTGGIDADGLKLEGDLFLRNGFHAEGEVRLVAATIGGTLDASGGTFENSNGNALNADGIKVASGVFLRNGFTAKGEATRRCHYRRRSRCEGRNNLQKPERSSLECGPYQGARQRLAEPQIRCRGRGAAAGCRNQWASFCR